MADGRDEVGAARDWLRGHGVAVPEGPEPARSPSGGTAGANGTDPDDGTDVGRRLRGAGRGRGRGERPPVPARTSAPSGAASAENSSRRRRARGDADGGGHDGPAGPAGPDGPDADPEQVARTIVLRKLTAQSRTRAELERALRSKEVPEEAAAAVLDRMGEVGLVDDAAFARDWVASRQQRRHLSRTALRRELQTKGVDREVIDEALADVGGADEHRAALDLARRRASPMAGLPREVAYRRLGGVLARRGFSASVTARVLSEVLEATDED